MVPARRANPSPAGGIAAPIESSRQITWLASASTKPFKIFNDRVRERYTAEPD